VGIRPALALCVLLLGGGAAAQPATLRIAASEANGSPFVIYDRAGRLSAGLARDIMANLAVELGRQPDFRNPPRSRIELLLQQGELDAACFLAPDWVAEPQKLAWSPPLFSIQQVIVQPASSALEASPEGLQGRRIGAQLGFTYPELQPLFAAGRLQRVDAPTLDNTLDMLARGRVDAVVNVDLAVFHRVEAGRLPLAVRVDPLWAPPSPVYCAFSPAFVAAEPDYAVPLQAMLDDGRLAAWIARYTGGRVARANPH
jgi:polar amino acid transport system substrate-binding protein